MKLGTILLVEDNRADQVLFRQALKEMGWDGELKVVCDGVEAIAFLRRVGKYTKESEPDLIVLDINIPKLNGIEVLTLIKADKGLSQLPIVIFTTSEAPSDKQRAALADCYIVKPAEVDKYFESVRETIEKFERLTPRPQSGPKNGS